VNVLVTGAAGFIGSHVVRELLRRDHDVVALVRPGTSLHRLGGLEDSIRTCRVNLADCRETASALQTIASEAVVHLAWHAEPITYLTDASRNLESLEASVRLLRLISSGSVRRVVLAGTCLETVGANQGRPAPIYARTKGALHRVAENMEGGLSVACAHVFSVYGPHENMQRAIPSIIVSLLRGDPTAVSHGHQLRDYVYVTDVARAFVTILESGWTGAVDICSGNPRPLRSVFEEIARTIGRENLMRWGAIPTSPSHAFDAVGDPAILHGLGWQPAYSLPEGINETVEWWRSATIPHSPGGGYSWVS
jgi:nucleoside-diphosphate-sugar epimerase